MCLWIALFDGLVLEWALRLMDFNTNQKWKFRVLQSQYRCLKWTQHPHKPMQKQKQNTIVHVNIG